VSRGIHGDASAAKRVVEALEGKPAATTLVLDYASPRHLAAAEPRLLALRERLAAMAGESMPGLCWHGQRVCGACRRDA
jgi:hypothetical protein